MNASTQREIDAAFSASTQQQVGGVFVALPARLHANSPVPPATEITTSLRQLE
jgi:hypothetical protein